MKKIVLILVLILWIFLSLWTSFAKCEYSGDIKASLNGCLNNTDLVKSADVKVEWWFKDVILNWIKNISIFLSVMAVWSIVYWAFMMTISAWEEEKIKKWKDIVKWWILWFLAIISAWWLIALVVNVIYSLGK